MVPGVGKSYSSMPGRWHAAQHLPGSIIGAHSGSAGSHVCTTNRQSHQRRSWPVALARDQPGSAFAAKSIHQTLYLPRGELQPLCCLQRLGLPPTAAWTT
jgi:hypothetical protein